jgi:hypothetical protein
MAVQQNRMLGQSLARSLRTHAETMRISHRRAGSLDQFHQSNERLADHAFADPPDGLPVYVQNWR